MHTLEWEVNNYEETEKDREHLNKKQNTWVTAPVASKKKTTELLDTRTMRFISSRKNKGTESKQLATKLKMEVAAI